ncbi:nucleotidyltransferase [Flavobacterium sp.]|uniref:nucleotidyltransferase n=1 Tax=Flavobacterium sp. TaxID=239 RepID=UPI0025C27066|nr:nucleotidyltransferase [Flavobacterium sp.]
MIITNEVTKSNILDEIGIALDLTEAQYKLVEDRYKAVGDHLCKDTSLLKKFQPSVMPQGSFLLGTMIKPIMSDDELDVDIVCRLTGKQDYWAQYHLKQEVKKQIEEDARYKQMLCKKEGKRCWRIDYAEDTKFHLDILPSVVDQNHFILLEKSYSNLTNQEIKNIAIRITDNTLDNYYSDTNTQNWMPSNPFGYAAWFNERKKTSYTRSLNLSESVKPLPKYERRKSPLQRVVQILKRHRDIMFGSNDDKPISIIITTLAAKSYRQEENMIDALLNILSSMRNHIQYEYSIKYGKQIAWVRNPVNDEENFADKWADSSSKEENFDIWLSKAQSDFEILRNADFTQIYKLLKTILGTNAVNEAFRKANAVSFITESYLPVTFDKKVFDVSHRAQPSWRLSLKYNIEIYGSFKQGKKMKSITPNVIVPKHCEIFFVASSNVPKPYDVFWQVVNTGDEAKTNQCLRGGIYHSKTAGKGGLNQKEYSEYIGMHWIECFIVKDGVCVARSNEFIVNVQ